MGTTIRQFMRIPEIAEALGCSESYIHDLAREMRDYPERYKKQNFFGDGKMQAVRFAAIQDYSQHRTALRNKRPVPEYNPAAVERDLGLSQVAPGAGAVTKEDMRILAAMVVEELGRAMMAGR